MPTASLLNPKSLCAVTAAFVLSFSPLIASLPQGIEKVQTLGGIEEYRLTSNGLRILLQPQESIPVATVMVTYEVGSRNESTGTTGATHILEHMMFMGTENFPTENKTDYSSQMESIGARSNATTYFDRTNYYATLPSEYVPLAIELEADRLRNLRLREKDLEAEMTVVRNEYERGENSPVRTLVKELFAAAFVAHPYGHPTIGWLSDIENTSTEKLRSFYDLYYWPENTVVTVIGGFDRLETLKLIAKHYGAISNAPEPIPEMTTEEPEQLGPRRVIIERAGQVGVVMIGYKVPPGVHEDWAALTLLDQVLTADKNGRLYRALEDTGKANGTFAFGPQLRDGSLFLFGAYLTPEATHEEAEAIMLEELGKVIHEGITEEELNRAKSVIRARTIYKRDGPYEIADELNEAIAMGDWTTYVKLPQQIEETTAAELQAVAKKYFIDRSSTTGWFVPQKTETKLASSDLRPPGPNNFREPSAVDSPHDGMLDFSNQMKKAKINGIHVIAVDMPVQAMITFTGAFAAGDAMSPAEFPALASITASMLDKGTQFRDRFEIAAELDTLGAYIEFDTDAHSLNFSGKFLKDNTPQIMGLLAEQLQFPALDSTVLDTVRSRITASLLQAQNDPDYRAEAELSRLIYGPSHPNFTEPVDRLIESVEALTTDDIVRFHEEHYGPRSMVLVFAGDIDFETLTASIKDAFGSWSGGLAYPEIPFANGNNAGLTSTVPIADKTSVSVRMGYATGLQRSEPDYLPFMMANYILGANFNARLMTEVRQKQGLTYNIRSYHQGDILTKGNWALTASFAPDLLDKGLSVTQEVLEKWFDEGVTQTEFENALRTQTGSYLVGLSTTQAVAGQILSFMKRGLPPEYIDTYIRQLKQLELDQVNAAIPAHFQPSLISTAMAGPVEKTESNLRTLTIRLNAPDSSWGLWIDQVYRTDNGLIAIAKLARRPEIAAQVITSVSETVEIAADSDIDQKYYVLGKTWGWDNGDDHISYIDSLQEIGNLIEDAELIFDSK